MTSLPLSFLNFRNVALAGVASVAVVAACSSSSNGTSPGNKPDASTDGSTLDAEMDVSPIIQPDDTGAPTSDGSVDAGHPGPFNVFDHIPMFNMYTSTPPSNYTPPANLQMWQNGTVFVTKLTAAQQALIGADLVAQVTYYAGCDNYDRIGGVFVVIEPTGQMPMPTDPRIELVRFITPFSDYSQGAAATYKFPTGSLSAFANVLADGSHDVWIGMGGGSYPSYQGNPCTGLMVDAGSDFLEIGFSYSLDFLSSKPLSSGKAVAIPAFTLQATGPEAGAPYSISNVPLTSTPIQGTITNPGSSSVQGHVTVIVSGHGSASGGDEYENTQDTLSIGSLDPDAGTSLGGFSTMIDCAPYASASPDGNPGIFMDNNSIINPRNWCPGALVVSHTFPATLQAGDNDVVLSIDPGQVPSGSYYQTSITFTSP
jgi:hypothetical protein